MKILNHLILNKEARLFDTKEFLIKAFIAVVLGFFVGQQIPYVSKDMISLLFGMILTIEPVNRTGIRTGLKQLEATILGATITGIILTLFGMSVWTAALTITLTLYVSLLIDWRNYSVVAMFTAIYMNTFVQTNLAGDPSQFETFKLRIAALLTGVLIAFVVNWLFSVFGYKHMLEKRIYHILDDLHGKMTDIGAMLEQESFEKAGAIMRAFPGMFNNMDWIYGTCVDFEKDPLVKRGQKAQVKLEKIMKISGLLREIGHVNYDVCYRISKGDHHFKEEAYKDSYLRTMNKVVQLEEKLGQIIHNKPVSGELPTNSHESEEISIREIDENINHIDALLNHYNKL